MKRTAVPLLAGALLAAMPTTTPAAAAEPAASNVRLAWKDSTFQHVTVTWDSDFTGSTVVVVRNQGETDGPKMDFVRAAGQPNRLDLDASLLNAFESSYFKPMEIVVRGASGTTPAVSVPFDAFAPDPVQLVSSTMTAAGVSTVRWKPSQRTDTTPNDPLDRTVPLTYQVSYTPVSTKKPVNIGTRSTAAQTTYTLRSEYTLNVLAYNEWGGQWPSGIVTAKATRLTAKVPAWAVYGVTNPRLTGTYTPDFERRQIALQARNTATGPWYTVASQIASGGRFEFEMGTGGSRQYRVVAPTALLFNGSSVNYAATTAPASSTTQLQAFGQFWWTQITYGRSNEARLHVSPAVNTTATLQRWNGKTWTTVGPVAVKNGYGVGRIVTAKPSRVTYRYYVPASTYGGLRFAASYTENFVNVVVPA